MSRRSDYVSRIVARAAGLTPPTLGQTLAPRPALAGPVEDPFLHADAAHPVEPPRGAPSLAPHAAPAPTPPDPFEAARTAPTPRAPITPDAAPVVAREHRVTERVIERTTRTERERLTPSAPIRALAIPDPFAADDDAAPRRIAEPARDRPSAPITPAPSRAPVTPRWLRPRDERPAWPPPARPLTPAPITAPRIDPPRAAIPVLRPVAPTVAAPRARRAVPRLTIGRVVVEVSRAAPAPAVAPPARAAAPASTARPFGAGGPGDLAIGRASGLGQG